MKVTNWGVLGNPFPNLSTDPSAQWPGASGVEYLNAIGLAVGAKDPSAPPGTPARRVSYLTEWSPISTGPEDRLYRTWETAPNGQRLVNDDGDLDPVTGNPRIDEEFLDGRDNDGDGLIDEDFGGIGYEAYTCLMRDDGAYRQTVGANPDAPLALECRQTTWDYSLAGLENFVAAEYRIVNRSGHALDSMFVGFYVDMDAGPFTSGAYFLDDRDLPGYPQGVFTRALSSIELQRQFPHAPIGGINSDSALCPRVEVTVNGFSLVDGDGDGGQTPGVASFLLLDHTVDPLGASAPARVGFRAFRSWPGGIPFSMGGNPNTDSLRYVFLSGTENVDPATGFVNKAPGASAGDYRAWCSVGPFRNLPAGGEVSVTVAFAVQPGSLGAALNYPADLAAYRAGQSSFSSLTAAHPALGNAFEIQKARDGGYERRSGLPVPDFHGRETVVRVPPGMPPVFLSDCRDLSPRIVTDQAEAWFDFDCDYCTGAWEYAVGMGLLHFPWRVSTSVLDVAPAEPAQSTGIRIVSMGPNPSPGRSALTLGFSRPGPGWVDVYDFAGRRVRRVDAGPYAAGRRTFVWDRRDDQGREVAPGIYVWKAALGGDGVTQKLVLTR